MRLAKETGVPIFLVGHVTKDGAIAVEGPGAIVDTVLTWKATGGRSFASCAR